MKTGRKKSNLRKSRDFKYIKRVKVPENKASQSTNLKLYGKHLSKSTKIIEKSVSEKEKSRSQIHSPSYSLSQSSKSRLPLQSKSPFVRKMNELENSKTSIRAPDMVVQAMPIFPSLIKTQNSSPNMSILLDSEKDIFGSTKGEQPSIYYANQIILLCFTSSTYRP